MEFTNREIAILFWLSVLLVLALLHSNTRPSLGQVVKAFFAPKLSALLAIALTYIIASVFILSFVGIWQWANLKTTVLWGITSAFVAMFDAIRLTGDKAYFRKLLYDIFNVTVVVTFIAEFYSFGLLIELVLFPLLAFIGILHAYSEKQPESDPVKKLLGWIMISAGLWILIYSGYQMITNFHEVATKDTALEFGIPIILSLSFLPFIYFLNVYITYENSFIRIGLSIKDRSLLRYAKWQARIHFRTDLDFLRRWARHIAINDVDSREAVKQSIQHIKAVKKREKNPPIILKEDGWSPYVAKDFLKEVGLPTKDYHHSYGEEWRASSEYKQVSDDLIPDNIAYYIEGNERSATCLKLRLYLNNPNTSDASEEQFYHIAAALMMKALHGVQEEISMEVGMQKDIDGTVVRLIREDWNGGIKGRYDLTLTLTRRNTKQF